MSHEHDPMAPHEPEIEFLGRVVRVGLGVVRVVLWVAGAAAIGMAIREQFEPDLGNSFLPHPPPSTDDAPAGLEPGTFRWAAGPLLWLCPGVVLVAPVDTLFTRQRWWLLGVSAMLWFAPMLLDDDSRYGFILRMFGTLCAFLTVFVWRSLWKLTKPFGGGTEPGSTSPLS